MIVLSLIVLVLTGLLVGAIVIILKLYNIKQQLLYIMYYSGSDQKMKAVEPETDVNMAYGTPREIMALRNAAL